MKQEKLKESLEEIKIELGYIRGMLQNVSNQMQELRNSIRGAPISTQVLPVSQPYVHPWWQHQWTGPVPSRNNLGSSVQASSINLDKSGFTISGGEKETQGEEN